MGVAVGMGVVGAGVVGAGVVGVGVVGTGVVGAGVVGAGVTGAGVTGAEGVAGRYASTDAELLGDGDILSSILSLHALPTSDIKAKTATVQNHHLW